MINGIDGGMIMPKVPLGQRAERTLYFIVILAE